jgi:hypothetical protein
MTQTASQNLPQTIFLASRTLSHSTNIIFLKKIITFENFIKIWNFKRLFFEFPAPPLIPGRSQRNLQK